MERNGRYVRLLYALVQFRLWALFLTLSVHKMLHHLLPKGVAALLTFYTCIRVCASILCQRIAVEMVFKSAVWRTVLGHQCLFWTISLMLFFQNNNAVNVTISRQHFRKMECGKVFLSLIHSVSVSIWYECLITNDWCLWPHLCEEQR